MTSCAASSSGHASGDPYEIFRQQLFDAGLLVSTGIDGLYLRSGSFEAVVNGIDALVTRAGADQDAPAYHFPLVMRGDLLERTGYIKSFPDLAGSVQSFTGDDRAHATLLQAIEQGEPWRERLAATDLALCSAACHPLYPSQKGKLPAGGRRVEVFGQCFRRDQASTRHACRFSVSTSSSSWATLRARAPIGMTGSPEHSRSTAGWVSRSKRWSRTTRSSAGPARSSRRAEREEVLKIEIVSPICSTEQPTAITSANCHLDHFGDSFEIQTNEGEVAHTACVGFGLERITLALFHTHGLDPTHWPSGVRGALGL